MKHLVLSVALVMISVLSTVSTPAQKTKKPDFAKKIAEATPQALPQSPVDNRPSTDARDEGLKGKVKGVTTFIQSAGTHKRVPDGESYYNEIGNLTTVVHYDEGFPHVVTVFGYVDGMRVNRSGDVAYEPGEKPPSKQITFTVRAEDNTKDQNAPRDSRYKMRDVREYDSRNRLIEGRGYQNNGELWQRTTYRYSGNLRTEQDFDRDGNEMSKTNETLDAAGNVISQLMYGGDDEPPLEYVMSHEFDGQGNWIVERTYEIRRSRNKKTKKLLWTSYRTITYYP